MSDYNIRSAFERIENELIASMIRNMKRHREWEDDEGFNWEQWQALQLKNLEEYKRRNPKIFGKKFREINKLLEEAILKAREDGNMAQELELLEMVKSGKFKKPRMSKKRAETNAEFFKMNDRKMQALIDATVSDMEKAETAILRMANDKYRKIIFDAQVYANSGAGTYEQAVDMATRDFLAAGLNCVEYKNGARHTLKDYADMALRTASKRAYLTGEGEKRKEWGIATVIMNKRGNPCPLCLPFVGKVFIDDVWSGGEAYLNGKRRNQKPVEGLSPITGTKYPLLSDAISQGLYHPRCKDVHTTYFEGISTPPDDAFTKDEVENIKGLNKAEAEKQHAQRQAEKFERLENYSLDEENKQKYGLKKQEWADRVDAPDYVDPDVTAYKKARKELRYSEAKLAELEEKEDALMDKLMDAMDTDEEEHWNKLFESAAIEAESCREKIQALKDEMGGLEEKALIGFEKQINTNFRFTTPAKLEGMSFETAEKVADVYQKIFDKFPELKGRLNGFELKKIDDMEDYAQTVFSTGENNGRIFLNQTYFKSEYGLETLSKKLKRDVLNGHHPKGTDSFESVIVHEIGHSIDRTFEGIGLGNKTQQNKILKKLGIDTRDSEAVAKGLSAYATETPSEFMAEGFAEYILSDKPREIAREVGALYSGKIKTLNQNSPANKLVAEKVIAKESSFEDITEKIKNTEKKDFDIVELQEITVNDVKYTIDGVNVKQNNSQRELEVANILKESLGYKVELVPEVNGKYSNVKTPDYLLDGHRYDLKELEGKSKDAIRNAVHKKKDQAENFIIDISKCPLDMEEINRQMEAVFYSYNTEFVETLILVKDSEVLRILQRN